MFFYVVCFLFVFVVVSIFYSMLQVSLDCPFLIATSVFSNIYLIKCENLEISHANEGGSDIC